MVYYLHEIPKAMSPLLTIAVPTYNRGRTLKGNLEILIAQHKGLPCPEDVELLVCDNASPDETDSYIRAFVDQGAPIRAIRNETNIGPDLNFVKAMRLARGSYVWLLGDDDYLKPGALNTVYAALKDKPVYGLVHLQHERKNGQRLVECTDSRKFLQALSLNITFISTHIFRKELANLDALENYKGSFLIQVPAFMSAAVAAKKNLILDEDLLQPAKMSASNGGFNPYQVFIVNFLKIWRKFVPGWWSMEMAKYRLFRLLILDFLGRSILGKRTNHDTTGGWKILLRYYWECPYFYAFIPLKLLALLPAKLCGNL